MNDSKSVRIIASVVMLAAAALGTGGCGGPQWQAEKIAQIEGLHTPESAFVVPVSGEVYVSSMVAAATGDSRFNTTDGTGFITQLRPGGQIDDLQWVESTKAAPLHSIKGVCVLGGVLYVADIDRVRRISVGTVRTLDPIVIGGASMLNDVATDGKVVYVSDTVTGKIHRIDGESHTTIAGAGSANGMAFFGGKMFCVSWELHDIYEVDPTGKTAPQAFGLADKFKGLDGIVILPDGQFVVSDLKGDKVVLVGTDRKTVRTLFKAHAPADIALDSNRGLLYVPLFHDKTLAIYEIWR